MTVKSSLLEMLEKNKGEVLSGESIAGELGCTRAAVWKAVKSLREEGYHIEAGPNKGYMLAKDTNRLSQEGIRLLLDDPKVKIDIYDELESTNQTAKKEAMMGEAGHGAFVIARSQTAGRGRRGREFYSPADTGLYMSVILKPQGTIHDSLLITTAAAVAVYRAVAQLCGIQLDIKWVNDLFYKGKKVCGILTEAVTDFESGNIEFVVVGMGLNLYLDQENLPGELRNIAGALYETKEDAEQTDRNKLTATIVNELRKETADLKLSPDYVTHNMIPGHQITITDGKLFQTGICIGDTQGRTAESTGRRWTGDNIVLWRSFGIHVRIMRMGLLHEGRFLDVTIPFCVMIQNLLFVMKHPSETLRRQNLFSEIPGCR